MQYNINTVVEALKAQAPAWKASIEDGELKSLTLDERKFSVDIYKVADRCTEEEKSEMTAKELEEVCIELWDFISTAHSRVLTSSTNEEIAESIIEILAEIDPSSVIKVSLQAITEAAQKELQERGGYDARITIVSDEDSKDFTVILPLNFASNTYWTCCTQQINTSLLKIEFWTEQDKCLTKTIFGSNSEDIGKTLAKIISDIAYMEDQNLQPIFEPRREIIQDVAAQIAASVDHYSDGTSYLYFEPVIYGKQGLTVELNYRHTDKLEISVEYGHDEGFLHRETLSLTNQADDFLGDVIAEKVLEIAEREGENTYPYKPETVTIDGHIWEL